MAVFSMFSLSVTVCDSDTANAQLVPISYSRIITVIRIICKEALELVDFCFIVFMVLGEFIFCIVPQYYLSL